MISLGNAGPYNMQFLVSPSLLRMMFYYRVMALNYVEDISYLLGIDMILDTVKVKQIIPSIKDP